ncbi:MAG: transposase [Planctomycetota bacterium]
MRDDVDRLTFIRDVHEAFGARLLAYCIMDTHYHLMAECSEPEARALAAQFTRRYTRAFNKRHGLKRRLIDGPVDVRLKDTPVLVAKSIKYDHQNPVKARMVAHELVFEWSSARAFAGLARTPYPNVERARALVQESAKWALPGPCPLANLERIATPRVPADQILAAIACIFGCSLEELQSDERASPLPAARTAFVVLGRLEGYLDRQLAPSLGRSRVRMTTLAGDDVDLDAVRIARTLLLDAAMRSRLPLVAPRRVSSEARVDRPSGHRGP